jgi:hypothetical protein
MNFNDQLERKIIGKMNAIKKGEITPTESGIGKLFNLVTDVAMHENLMKRYSQVLVDRKNQQDY